MDACGRIEGLDLCFGSGDFKTKREFDKGLDLFQGNGSARAQEAVIPDLHESGRQDMLEETPHELHDVQVHGSPAVGFRLLVFEKDSVILDFNIRLFDNGHFEDVGREVFNGMSTCAYGLTIYHPVLIPDLFRDWKSSFLFDISCRNLALKILDMAFTGR